MGDDIFDKFKDKLFAAYKAKSLPEFVEELQQPKENGTEIETEALESEKSCPPLRIHAPVATDVKTALEQLRKGKVTALDKHLFDQRNVSGLF